jgi:hypothetical protein
MLNKKFSFSGDQFPFQTTVCIRPIIDYWRSKRNDPNPLVAALMNETEKLVQQAPELMHPITDESVLEKHRNVIDFLMSAVFPVIVKENEMCAAITPFGEYSFYHTPGFAKKLA